MTSCTILSISKKSNCWSPNEQVISSLLMEKIIPSQKYQFTQYICVQHYPKSKASSSHESHRCTIPSVFALLLQHIRELVDLPCAWGCIFHGLLSKPIWNLDSALFLVTDAETSLWKAFRWLTSTCRSKLIRWDQRVQKMGLAVSRRDFARAAM